jgi:dTDP-4-dehydrorhamnose reductase
MKYLIIGNKGQLGREFEKKFSASGESFTGIDIDGLDIAQKDKTITFIKSVKPKIILNCSAFNTVDIAENSPELAFAVNSDGVLNIALGAEEVNAKVVHYSTDYVFSGEKKDLYIESDIAAPLNKYGESKLAGENLLIKNSHQYLLFRLSWVYGDGNQNFIHKLLQWSANGADLKIADNEVSIPTSTSLIVDTTLLTLEKELFGLYHLTASGYCSRYDWASFVLDHSGRSNRIQRVKKEIFNLPARRPNFSAMSNILLSQKLSVTLSDWQSDLKNYIKNIF